MLIQIYILYDFLCPRVLMYPSVASFVLFLERKAIMHEVVSVSCVGCPGSFFSTNDLNPDNYTYTFKKNLDIVSTCIHKQIQHLY